MPATILVVVVGVVLMVGLPGAALLKLIVTATVLPALIYGATVGLYLAVRGDSIAKRARSISGALRCRSRSPR